MERVCEPELMDGAEQAAAYAAADFAAGDRALLQRLQQLFGAGLGSRIADLGCGPGNISVLLAEQYPAAHVVGLDGAAAMLQIAEQRRAAQPGRWPLLRFVQARLPAGAGPEGLDALEQLAGACSAVISNSLLHHLHDPDVLWSSLRQLAAPGACIYIKDLRRPASAEAVLALRDRYLAQAPPVLQHDYVASLHAAFTPAEVATQLQRCGLDQALQVAPLDDRYLEVWGVLP
jgi:trans-aconitate 2-methyltransferase